MPKSPAFAFLFSIFARPTFVFLWPFFLANEGPQCSLLALPCINAAKYSQIQVGSPNVLSTQQPDLHKTSTDLHIWISERNLLSLHFFQVRLADRAPWRAFGATRPTTKTACPRTTPPWGAPRTWPSRATRPPRSTPSDTSSHLPPSPLLSSSTSCQGSKRPCSSYHGQ